MIFTLKLVSGEQLVDMSGSVVTDIPLFLSFVLHLRLIKIPPTIMVMISTTRPTGIRMMVRPKLNGVLGSVASSVDETRR